VRARRPGLPLPLGPLPGVRAYVLDARRRLVPPGCVGDLHIGGPDLALGYLEEAQIQNSGFRDDPFLPGGRLIALVEPEPGRVRDRP
jgi:non-ribosomal peptide synthetase component F